MTNNIYFGASKTVFDKAEALKSNISPAGELLWDHLKDERMGFQFRRQHPAFLYVLDFYCHELKLAIELDGNPQQFKEVKANDPESEKDLTGLGIFIFRINAGDILEQKEKVYSKIDHIISERKKNIASIPSSGRGQNGMEIIPAIDIIDGKCVRLTQGDYEQKKIYSRHPLEVAKEFEDTGLKRLHLVDLDGARSGSIMNWKVLEAIAGKTSLVIDFGGGISSDKDLDIVFGSGAALATIGSLAVKDESKFTDWLRQYGAEKFLLGADVKEEKIAISGWQETTTIWIYDFLEKYIEKGVKQVFCTDVSKDGLLEGPSIELYKSIITKFPGLEFIASGGVSAMKDLDDLQNIGCKGVIIGKAIYEGKISLEELKRFRV